MTDLLAPARALDGPVAPPRQNGELVFRAPWEGRVVGMAVGLVDRLGLDWDEFRSRLIAAIAEDPDRPYYESWTAALEAMVVDLGLTGSDPAQARHGSASPG